MSPEQYQLWQRFKYDINRSSVKNLPHGTISLLLEENFSDSIYTYMIKKVLDTDDYKVFELLINDINHSFDDGSIKSLGDKSNTQLMNVFYRLLLHIGHDKHTLSYILLETVLRFLPYIQHNDLDINADMFDLLLYDIRVLVMVDHYRIQIVRDNDMRLARHLLLVSTYCDYSDDMKANTFIDYVSEFVYKKFITDDVLTRIMFARKNYATSLESRQRIYDRILRQANYMKLTNGNV